MYPDARRGDTVEEIGGRQVADPYRWLEDAGSEETKAFVEAQNALSRPMLDELPGRAHFVTLVDELLSAPKRGVPFLRGDHVFALHNDGQNQARLVRADRWKDLERSETILDPNEFSDDGTTSVPVLDINDDATLLAYGVSEGGSDWRTMRVRDLTTLKDLDVEVPWTKWSGPGWLPGGRSFTYWAYPEPTGDALTDEMPAGALHRFDVDSGESELLWEPDDPRTMAHHYPHDDEWLVLSTRVAGRIGNDIIARRHDEDEFRRVVEGGEDEWYGIGVRDGELIAMTSADAPRYRIVAVDLETGEQRELVPEHDEDSLDSAKLTKTGMVLVYLHNAEHRAQVFGTGGKPGEVVGLSDGVTVLDVSARKDSDDFFIATQSFVHSGTRFAVTTHGSTVKHFERIYPPKGSRNIEAHTRQFWTTSTDGTEVPAFLVAADDRAVPRPVLMWGYGGFNISETPGFRAVLAAWVDAGGALVVPNLRGGGEFGAAWHEAGTKERKQQVFDDLFAVAQKLIDDGITTPEQLALHGRSNGGLLAGAALTQRPELWAAVLPGVGVLDMLRYHLFTIGWAWIRDYGDPDDPEAAKYLLKYSPLHNVRDIEYPAVLVTTADHDDRVVPAHSYKFVAELQHTGKGGPFLLAVDTKSGHGLGKSRAAQVQEFADQLAFAAHHTGLDVG